MTPNPDPNELHKWNRKIDTLCVIIKDYFTFASQYTSESNNISQVKVRLEQINEFSEKFEEYQAELEMLEDKKYTDWIEVQRSFRNQLCDVKAALLKIVDEHGIHADNVSSSSISSARSQQRLNSFNSMRYTPCALPTFSGDWQKWSSFIDTFSSMFHNEDSKLLLVQRFHYLKALFVKSKEKCFGKCPLCTEHHKLYACSKFNNMSTNDRRNFVMKSRLCFNCLNFGHGIEDNK